MKLRNNGMFSETDYRGKTLEEATKYAKSGGFITRIVETNGVPLMIDMSVRGDRINFRVSGDIVVAAFGG